MENVGIIGILAYPKIWVNMFIKKENIICSLLSDDSILYSQSYDLMNFGSILNYKAPMR
jgi:hypothetical protein